MLWVQGSDGCELGRSSRRRGSAMERFGQESGNRRLTLVIKASDSKQHQISVSERFIWMFLKTHCWCTIKCTVNGEWVESNHTTGASANTVKHRQRLCYTADAVGNNILPGRKNWNGSDLLLLLPSGQLSTAPHCALCGGAAGAVAVVVRHVRGQQIEAKARRMLSRVGIFLQS